MANHAQRRIEERIRIAEERMQEQGLFDRTMSQIGLAAANTMDKLTAWADDERAVFMGGTMLGLARGAFYGAFASLFLIAFIPPLAAIGGMIFIASVVTGAVTTAAYEGQNALEARMNDTVPHLSDDVAHVFGTTPKKGDEVHITKNSEETLREAGRTPGAEERAVAALKRDISVSHTAREDIRRQAASANLQPAK